MSLSQNEPRSLPAWTEFAEAFCAGYNARKDGVTEDNGDDFIAALMAAYERWQGKRIGVERAATMLDEAIDRELSEKHWGGMGGPETRRIVAGVRSHLTTAQVRLRRAIEGRLDPDA